MDQKEPNTVEQREYNQLSKAEDGEPGENGILDEQKTLDKYLNKVGGLGCYQVFSILAAFSGFSGMNFIIYFFSYYELYPKYLCTYKDDPTKEV